MRNFNFKKVIVLFLAILCFGVQTVSFSVMAALPSDSETVSPMNIAIRDTYIELSLKSAGVFRCYGKTEVKSGYYSTTVVELQKKDGGYTTVKTWADTDLSYSTVNEDYSVDKGTYRLKVTHKAYDSNLNLIESITQYTNDVTY